ncbi:hypothetical protein Tco_0564638 [Tanacetum coccineum]
MLPSCDGGDNDDIDSSEDDDDDDDVVKDEEDEEGGALARQNPSAVYLFGIEVCGCKEEDVRFGELGEGGIGVLSRI